MPEPQPPEKPWAGRFSAPTREIVERYTSSIAVDRRLAAYDIAGSIAHARMLGRQGIIPAADAEAIAAGLARVAADLESGAWQLSDHLEDVHMNVEARLHETIGEAAGRLHTARSRNDQVALDLRMFARDQARDAVRALTALMTALVELAEGHRGVVMPGYTHLQRAQPVLFSHHMLAYFEMFDRDRGRFHDALRRIDVMPLGSGALAGGPYPLDRAFVAAELGFTRISENSLDAVSDRDFVVELEAAAALAMVHVSRLAEEIVLWSGAEFRFIELDDAFATGSSIMPQKKNPDVAELARGKTGRVVGALVATLTTLKGLPLSYNRDLQEDKPPFFDAIDTLLDTLQVFTAMLPAIRVNAPVMRRAASGGYALATDFADYLVMKGLPFRQAHSTVGRIVAYAAAKGVDFAGLTLEELRGFSPLFDEDATRISVRSSLASRALPGGTAPRTVAAALRRARRRLQEGKR